MSLGIINVLPTGATEWACVDGARVVSAGEAHGLPGAIAALPQTERVCLIIPGEHAATRRLRLPVRGSRALKDAVHLALDDQLADGIADYEVAIGEADEDGFRRIVAFPRAMLETILDEALTAGIDPDVITPDHAVIAQPEASATILYKEQRVLASLPDGALTGDAETLTPIVAELAPEDDVVVAEQGPGGPNDEGTALRLPDVEAWARFTAAALQTEPPPNLRGGALAKRTNWRGLSVRWRQAAALMAACFGVWIVNVVADGMKHHQATDRLLNEASATFTQAFPGVPIRDLRRQAAQRQRTGATSAFLPLMADLTVTIDSEPRLVLAGVRYTEENQVIADLRFPDSSALEALKQRLEERGVRVREGGNLRRDENGNFVGQLFLEARR